MKENKMKILRTTRFFLLFCIIAVASIIATGGCDNGGGSCGFDTGMLSLGLTDAPTDNFQAVYVTIREVSVHTAGNDTEEGEDGSENLEGSDYFDNENGGDKMNAWKVIAKPEKTYNLLELVDGVVEQLGVGELDAGHYTQMRLLLGIEPDEGENILGVSHPFSNYVIDDSGNTTELKVPSGYQSGIKLVHGFDIQSNETTQRILDFDASKSVVSAGKSGKILLKPTIKVLDGITSPLFSGQVSNGEEGISGVYISAQTYNPDAEDARDEVVVSTGTTTDENGLFTLRLEPGYYNIVAYKDDYDPACFSIATENNSEYLKDFILESTETELISYSIEEVSGENSVSISIRQLSSCQDAGEDRLIEITSHSIAEKGDYGISLPKLPSGGTYVLVASSDSQTEICEWSSDSILCEIDFSQDQ